MDLYLKYITSHKHVCLLTIVTEWISPIGIHSLSLGTQSWAKNVAGTTEDRYKNILCLPGPMFTSHEDISVKNRKRGSQIKIYHMETYHSYKQNDSPALKGQVTWWLPLRENCKMKHECVNLLVKTEQDTFHSEARLAISHLHTHLRVSVHSRWTVFLSRKTQASLRRL